MTVALVGLIVIGVFAYVFLRRPPPTQYEESRTTSAGPAVVSAVAPTAASVSVQPTAGAQATLALHLDWLHARWKEADIAQEAKRTEVFPKWFFDAATEPQVRRLTAEGVHIDGGAAKLTKGQASDVIGLFEPPDEPDADVLRFFKVGPEKLNQTRGRPEAASLLADPEKKASFQARAVTAMQREQLRILGAQGAKAKTYAQAQELIELREEELEEAGATEALEEWTSFEGIVAQLNDRKFRSDYGIKEPSFALIREAVESLKAEGQTMRSLEDDPQEVVDRLIQLKPELAR